VKSIADALVFAVSNIEERPEVYPGSTDDDLKALESIAGALRTCSRPELEALAAAAERAHREHLATYGGAESPYRGWMESVFGPPWVGNQEGGID
jgi:hypothetical protein